MSNCYHLLLFSMVCTRFKIWEVTFFYFGHQHLVLSFATHKLGTSEVIRFSSSLVLSPSLKNETTAHGNAISKWDYYEYSNNVLYHFFNINPYTRRCLKYPYLRTWVPGTHNFFYALMWYVMIQKLISPLNRLFLINFLNKNNKKTIYNMFGI